MASKNSDYGLRSYWEGRFEKEDHYEWLGSYEDIIPSMRSAIAAALSTVKSRKRADVLLVGCGNSNFSAKLAAEYTAMRVTSIDFSNTVIENMRIKYPDLIWKVADMTDMREFLDSHFDVVIDKAACDALVTNEGDP